MSHQMIKQTIHSAQACLITMHNRLAQHVLGLVHNLLANLVFASSTLQAPAKVPHR